MSDEKMNSPKNILALLAVWVFAIIINPFVKLKDWIKGEKE